MAYEVVAPCVWLVRRTAPGLVREIWYQGSPLPNDVDGDNLRFLIRAGMVAESMWVPPPAAPADTSAAAATAMAQKAIQDANTAASKADAAAANVVAATDMISPALAASLADRAQLNQRMASREQAAAKSDSDITALRAQLDTAVADKAAANHTHDYAAPAHTHSGYASAGHTHTYLSEVHQTSAVTPAILLGASVDVTLTWPTAFTSTAYSVEFTKGPGLIGSSSVALKSKTTTGCVATVSATLAVSLGSILFAQGYR